MPPCFPETDEEAFLSRRIDRFYHISRFPSLLRNTVHPFLFRVIILQVIWIAQTNVFANFKQGNE